MVPAQACVSQPIRAEEDGPHRDRAYQTEGEYTAAALASMKKTTRFLSIDSRWTYSGTYNQIMNSKLASIHVCFL